MFTLEIYGVKKIVGIPFGYRGFFEEGLPEIPVRIFLVKMAIFLGYFVL